MENFAEKLNEPLNGFDRMVETIKNDVKSPVLITVTPESVTPANAPIIAEITGRQIQQGFDNPYASAGTPIASLAGGAQTNAQLSNVGGGSKATGGNGMKGGVQTMLTYAYAKGMERGTAK